MTHDTATVHLTGPAGGAEPMARQVELARLRSERALIEAARDFYYHRWLADEELLGKLRLHVKHLEDRLSRSHEDPP